MVRNTCQCNGTVIKISVSEFVFRYIQRQLKNCDGRDPLTELGFERISEKSIKTYGRQHNRKDYFSFNSSIIFLFC